MAQALHNKGWVTNIKMDANLTVPHIHEYLRLRNRLEGVHLHGDNVDTISLNITSNGEYSLASAYEAQFFGAMLTNFNKMVWKNWASPRSNSSLGWLSGIDYGRRTGLRKGGGKIVVFARFASKRKIRRLIFSPIVAIPRGFGTWSRIGLAYPLFILTSGLRPPPSKCGG
jgi:hypothetical protein